MIDAYGVGVYVRNICHNAVGRDLDVLVALIVLAITLMVEVVGVVVITKGKL